MQSRLQMVGINNCNTHAREKSPVAAQHQHVMIIKKPAAAAAAAAAAACLLPSVSCCPLRPLNSSDALLRLLIWLVCALVPRDQGKLHLPQAYLS
jgi:hypothetical protein